jgi:Ca-activated chloride channel family protein
MSRRSRHTLFGSLAIALVAGTTTQLDAQRAAFRTGVEMVPLTVTVTDASGNYVTNLADRDFVVLEDGIQQPVSFFASEQVPVDLAIVLDVSASMRPHLPLVRKAAGGLVRSLRAADRAMVVAVKNAIGVPQPMTTDQRQIEDAIGALTASGETALYDGLYVALKELERERLGTTQIRKQAIVLLSDGLDTTSRLGFEDVLDLARRSGVNVYVIAMPSSSTPVPRNEQDGRVLQSEYALRSLAREAGGRSFFPKRVQELPAIYGDIAHELANQYELAYLPLTARADRGFRRISVRVENAVTRTRSGYYQD